MTIQEPAIHSPDPDWRRLRLAAWAGVLRYLLRIRRAPVVAGVVLLLVAEESGNLVRAELRRVARITRVRVAGTTTEPELRQTLFEVHVLPGSELVVTHFLRDAIPDAQVSRLPRARQEADPARTGNGIQIDPWVTEAIQSHAGGDGGGATVVVLDGGFDPDVLARIGAETSLAQLDVLEEFQKPRRPQVEGHGTAVLSLVHAAAPKAALLWQFEPETPDVSIWKPSDTASRVWLIAYMSMIRDLHTEGYPKRVRRPVVVNLSLSLGFGDAPGADDSALAAVLDSVLAPAVAAGIVLVAAAGNAPPAHPMAYPAISAKTIAVGSLNRNGWPAAHSRGGGKAGLWLMAPGEELGRGVGTEKAGGSEGTLSGTSYACAIASGLIAGAAASSDRPGWLTGDAVKDLLRKRALPYEGWSPESECAGRINVKPQQLP